MKTLLRWLFEKFPPLAIINGNKQNLSRLILMGAAVLGALKQFYPEVPNLDDMILYYSMIAGWLGLEVGLKHADVKKSLPSQR